MDPKQQVDALRSALQQAQKTISDQSEMLETIVGNAQSYGIIVRTGGKTIFRRRPTPDDFKKNVKVKISEEHKGNYNDSIRDLVGTIESLTVDGDLEVYVRFTNGKGGNIEIDRLELVDTDALLSEKESVTIAVNDRLYEVVKPSSIRAEPGMSCTLSMKTMQIYAVAPLVQYGATGIVKETMDEQFCLITTDGNDKVVFSGKFGKELEKGDLVFLDPAAIIVLKNKKKETKDFSVDELMTVSWDDIGGLEEAKKLMIEMVELPHTNPGIYQYYNKRLPKGVLLYGPPGCGKTLLGKAAAYSLAKIYKGKAQTSGFIYIKGPEILNKFVGSSEESIRSIFIRAREHKKQFGFPATIFIDEADAILSKRGSGISSDVEKTIVPMFLTEMDGLEDSGAFIILATNRPDILDPAVVRDGRIDRKIKITRPTKESAKEIFLLNVKKTPLEKKCTKERLANLAVEKVFSAENVLYNVQFEGIDTQEAFTLDKVVNGAMIANIVDTAISAAMRRDLLRNTKTGVNEEDIVQAVATIAKENRELDHKDELRDFIGEFGKKAVRLSRFGVTGNEINLN